MFGGDDVFESLDRVLTAAVERGRVAGAVGVVMVDGDVVYEVAVGWSDREQRLPVTVDTTFQLRSVTKGVTAAAVLQLVDEGTLRLGQPVADILPEFGARRVQSRPILVRDLLLHVSGLPHGWEVSGAERPGDWTEISLAEEVAGIAALPAVGEPGEAFVYSDLGYSVLGRVVEVVDGAEFDDVVRRRIFGPLAMDDSWILPSADAASRMAVTYEMADGSIRRNDAEMVVHRRNPLPGAGLLSTAKDVAVFHEMMRLGGAVADHRVLSPAAVSLATTVATGDLPRWPGAVAWPANWGLGWSVAGTVATDLRGDLASVGSFWCPAVSGARCWVDPALKLVGVLLVHLFPATGRPWANQWLGSVFTQVVSAAVSSSLHREQ